MRDKEAKTLINEKLVQEMQQARQDDTLIREPEYPLWLEATNLIAEANMAAIYEPDTLNQAILHLKSLIDTGYYDDEDGNELMKHMVRYLEEKLGGHD